MFAFFPTLIGQEELFYDFIIGDRAGMTDNQRQVAVERNAAVEVSNSMTSSLRDNLNLSDESVNLNCFGLVDNELLHSEYNIALGISIAGDLNSLRVSAQRFDVDSPPWYNFWGEDEEVFSVVGQSDFTTTIFNLYVVRNHVGPGTLDNTQLQGFYDKFIDAEEIDWDFQTVEIAEAVDSIIFLGDKVIIPGEEENVPLVEELGNFVFLRKGNALFLIPAKNYGSTFSDDACADTLDADYLPWDCFTDEPSSDNLISNIEANDWIC